MKIVKELPLILRILGFTKYYRLDEIQPPVIIGGYYHYKTRIAAIEIHWLNFRIWKKILKH